MKLAITRSSRDWLRVLHQQKIKNMMIQIHYYSSAWCNQLCPGPHTGQYRRRFAVSNFGVQIWHLTRNWQKFLIFNVNLRCPISKPVFRPCYDVFVISEYEKDFCPFDVFPSEIKDVFYIDVLRISTKHTLYVCGGTVVYIFENPSFSTYICCFQPIFFALDLTSLRILCNQRCQISKPVLGPSRALKE